jgi:hypothetical protein
MPSASASASTVLISPSKKASLKVGAGPGFRGFGASFCILFFQS